MSKEKKTDEKAGLLEKHTVDGYNGFVFLREDGQVGCCAECK